MGILSALKDGFSSHATFVNFVALLFIWFVTTAVYRLYLGPLAAFPGRKLAILTGWYETYFECVKRGRYWIEIQKMHEEYGPIVRINPWELHVNDPDWTEIYKISAKTDKDPWYYRAITSPHAAFGTIDYDLHRVRRKAQHGYFTLDAITNLEPVLTRMNDKLLERLAATKGTNKISNLANAFRAQATDIVTEISFGKSYDLLDQDDFAATFHNALRDMFSMGHWQRHLLIVVETLQLTPRWFLQIVNPATLEVLDFFEDAENHAKAGVAAYKPSPEKNVRRTNIVHQMLDSPQLGEKDKAMWRLALEVRVVIGAGTETIGNTLTTTCFYLLSNPDKTKRLREEVRAAQRESETPLTAKQLAILPYLSAVVLEGHRIASSVSGRLPRINKRETMQYGDMVIPKNTVVSTTQQEIFFNSTIFPDPHSFIPERWLDPTTRKGLDKYMHPFGIGGRSCIGIHLANSVLHLTLAKLFSAEFDMQLFDTNLKDVELYHDWFGPFPETQNGVRVKVV